MAYNGGSEACMCIRRIIRRDLLNTQLPGFLPTSGDYDLVNLGGIQASIFSTNPKGDVEPQSSLESTALGST